MKCTSLLMASWNLLWEDCNFTETPDLNFDRRKLQDVDLLPQVKMKCGRARSEWRFTPRFTRTRSRPPSLTAFPNWILLHSSSSSSSSLHALHHLKFFLSIFGVTTWQPDNLAFPFLSLKVFMMRACLPSNIHPIPLTRNSDTVHTGYSAIGYSANPDIVSIVCPHFWSHLLICY